jgi:hypothetical protein
MQEKGKSAESRSSVGRGGKGNEAPHAVSGLQVEKRSCSKGNTITRGASGETTPQRHRGMGMPQSFDALNGAHA